MKDIYVLGLAILLSGAVAFTGLPQQKEKNDKKEQQQENKGKKQNKDLKGKKDVPPGQEKKNSPGQDNGNTNNQGNKNKNAGFRDKIKEKMQGGNNPYINAHDRDGWEWDNETFRDRKKYRNGEKVTICHKFNGNEPAVTLNVSVNALKAHLNHGDVEGDCPDVDHDRYSDDYLRERNDYYERIQRSREQVLYSRSILDYALQRLTDSRAQLVTMRNNNVPTAEIQRKEAVVLQLQEDVSLLETLIGVTAGLIANKLQ